jgi:hypothetical protein
MDLLWYARSRRSGGQTSLARWEFALDVQSWDDAPAPARVGRLIADSLADTEISVRYAPALNNLMHWGYGTTAGVVYGLVFAARNHTRVLPRGAIWGAAVWASSFVTLALLDVYEPIWRYDRRTLWRDLGAHIVFGMGTAGTCAILAGQAS